MEGSGNHLTNQAIKALKRIQLSRENNTFKQRVVGSSPTRLTIYFQHFAAPAKTRDLAVFARVFARNLLFLPLRVCVQAGGSVPQSPSLVVLCFSKTDLVLCPVMVIATRSGTPAPTRFLTARESVLVRVRCPQQSDAGPASSRVVLFDFLPSAGHI